MTLNLIATALAAAYLVSPAFAQDAANDTDTRIVSTRGLDLSTSDGIRILDLKLGRAVADVCGVGSAADPERERNMLACRRDVRIEVSAERASAIAAARPSADGAMLAIRTR